MRRPDLVADCGSCAALCCTATCFDASDDFAVGKAAGARCPHLMADCRCQIHDVLVEKGFRGCAAYDCYGAGQRATRAFAEASAETRNAAFLVLRDVHELIWLLSEAMKICPPACEELSSEIGDALGGLDAVARSDAATLIGADARLLGERAHALLRRVGDALGGRSGLVRISCLRGVAR